MAAKIRPVRVTRGDADVAHDGSFFPVTAIHVLQIFTFVLPRSFNLIGFATK